MSPHQDAENAALLVKHTDEFVDPQLCLVAGLLAITSKTTCNTVITLNMEAICSFETLETPLVQGVQTLKTNCVRSNCAGVPNIRVPLQCKNVT